MFRHLLWLMIIDEEDAVDTEKLRNMFEKHGIMFIAT